jgi:hypothetical protein
VEIITRWELSGNGDGQRMEGDRDFGHVESLDFRGDNRKLFLQNERTTMLYYWQMLDKYQILSETLTVLAGEQSLSTSTGSVAMTSSTKKRRRDDSKSDEFVDTLRHLASGISTTSKTQALERVLKTQEAFLQLVKLAEEATSPTLKQLYEERAVKAKNLLDKAEQEYDNLN